jgi:hypothetical protein
VSSGEARDPTAYDYNIDCSIRFEGTVRNFGIT